MDYFDVFDIDKTLHYKNTLLCRDEPGPFKGRTRGLLCRDVLGPLKGRIRGCG